jgi:hypothetical protein
VTERPRRRVVVMLAPDEWDRLVLRADAEARDPFQQARWLILRALGNGDDPEPGYAGAAGPETVATDVA